jgi:23S rRNA (guanosine2251-2'-O)-methyltransferase
MWRPGSAYNGGMKPPRPSRPHGSTPRPSQPGTRPPRADHSNANFGPRRPQDAAPRARNAGGGGGSGGGFRAEQPRGEGRDRQDTRDPRRPQPDRAKSGPRPGKPAPHAQRPAARSDKPAPRPDRTPFHAEKPDVRTSERVYERTPRTAEASLAPTHSSAPHPGRPSAAAAPRGTVWLYGLHAVQAALTNPARRLRRLVTTEEGAATLAGRLPRPWSVTPETVDRARLDGLLGRDAVHQGVALLADLLAPPILATVLERPGPILVLDQVTDPRNIGAILRSAAAFGVAAVILQERHAPEETGSLAKAASGALESLPLIRAVNLARTLVVLKAANYWVVGLDAEAPANLHGPAFTERRVALVLGGEGAGLRRLTRESCDELAKLPMAAGAESLNVSAAAAVALYELQRRS